MDRRTQQRRILDLLRQREWTPLPMILDLRIAKYSSRLAELRHQGYIIECREEREGRVRHTFYKLVYDPHAPRKSQHELFEARVG